LDQRSEYQQVAVYARLEEAELARGLLEADGIPAALLDAHVAALGLGAAVGGVRLLAPAWSTERAAELLSPPPLGADDWPATTPTPLPGTLRALAPLPATAAGPAPAAPGPLALRVAVAVALALLAAVMLALLR
jgi:hypothetical protein